MFNNVAGDKEMLYTKESSCNIQVDDYFFLLINAFVFLCVEHVGRFYTFIF